MLAHYDGSMAPEAYYEQFREAITAGQEGQSLPEARRRAGSGLTAEATKAAWELGQEMCLQFTAQRTRGTRRCYMPRGRIQQKRYMRKWRNERRQAMTITELERTLMKLLRASELRGGIQALIYIVMETDEQKKEMCKFLRKNGTPTEEEIVDEAHRIRGD